jgi:hypothetical protein
MEFDIGNLNMLYMKSQAVSGIISILSFAR